MKRLQGLSLGLIGFALMLPHLVALGYHPFSFEVVGLTSATFGILCFLGAHTSASVYKFLLSYALYWFFDAYFIDVANPYWLLLATLATTFLIARFSLTALPFAVGLFSIGFAGPSFLDFPGPLLAKSENATHANVGTQTPEFAIVHLIMDEAGSPLALPKTDGFESYAQDRFEAYQNAGFRTYGLAVSEEHKTVRSLGRIFGLTDNPNNFAPATDLRHFSYMMKEHDLISTLANDGFEVSVIQSNYLEICPERIAVSCETYSRGLNMSAMSKVGASYGDRITYAFAALHESFLVLNHKVVLYDFIVAGVRGVLGETGFPAYGYFSRPIDSVKLLDEISERTKNIKPGEALIAHLLFPHYPYVLDAQCGLKPIGEWALPSAFDPLVDLDMVYDAFRDQDRCAAQLILDLAEAVKDRDDLVIIIHGDHGTRIAERTEFKNALDTKGTFFAIKAPGVLPELVTDPVSLQEVFYRYFNEVIDN